MRTLILDLKFAMRMLRRDTGFTMMAVLALALGIGATTAIYTAVDAVLWRPLCFSQPQQLVVVTSKLHGHRAPSSFPDIVDLRARNHSLAGIAAWSGASAVLTGDANPRHLNAVKATPNLFRVLGVQPALGRAFNDEEGRPNSHVVVISHELWRNHFVSDPGIVGRSMSIDGQPYVIVGVTPAGFRFPIQTGSQSTELFLTYPRDTQDAHDALNRSAHSLTVIGRLRPDATLEQASADLATAVTTMRADHADAAEDQHLAIEVTPLRDAIVGASRPALLLLLVAVVCVLLITCANVAGLLLARSTVRQREIAIRTALGAGRGRLVRQMLTESVLLGLLGGGGGLLLAYWLVDVLAGLARSALPQVHDITVDHRVLLVSFTLAVGSGILFGLAPALLGSTTDIHEALKESARSTGHSGGRRARKVLLVGEIAVALVLLAGAGLSLRSFAKLDAVDPGFRPDGLAVARAHLPNNRYPDDESVVRYYRRLSDEVRRLPGVESFGVAATLPFTQVDMAVGVHLPGQPPSQALPAVRFTSVGPGYFETMKIPLERGRTLTTDDDRAEAPARIVVSKSFAIRLLGNDDPIGKHVVASLGEGNVDHTECEVIGVVGDVHQQSLDEKVTPTMYFAFARFPMPFIGVVARGHSAAALVPGLRAAMLTVDELLPPPLDAPMTSLLADTLGSHEILMALLGLFAVVALVLASVGVYGVTAYSVAQRTREIGIRMALGARPGSVLTLVLSESLRLSIVATALGVAAAVSLARLARSFVFGVSVYDPSALIAAALVILTVCLLASFLPARRATTVDPMVALHDE